MAIGTAAAIGLAIAGAGTAGVLYNQNRAVKQQERALAYQKQQDALKLNLQRREMARAARVANANAALGAATAGAGQLDGSASEGGRGAILSQYSANLGFSTQMSLISDQISTALGKAATHGAYAQMFGGVAQLGLSLAAAAPAPNKADTTTTKTDNRTGGGHTVPF